MEETNSQNIEERFQYCSFCKISKQSVVTLISARNACICPNCALGAHKTLVEKTAIRTEMRTKYDIDINRSVVSSVVVIGITIAAMLFAFFYFK
jgi:ATP-dependent protease Clp ATPase subunit